MGWKLPFSRVPIKVTFLEEKKINLNNFLKIFSKLGCTLPRAHPHIDFFNHRFGRANLVDIFRNRLLFLTNSYHHNYENFTLTIPCANTQQLQLPLFFFYYKIPIQRLTLLKVIGFRFKINIIFLTPFIMSKAFSYLHMKNQINKGINRLLNQQIIK